MAKKNIFKNPLLIVGVLLLFTVAGLLIYKNSFYVKPNKNGTNTAPLTQPVPSDWKTYNLDNVLTFRYPPNYLTYESPLKVDVFDSEKNLGPNNLYLSINATNGGTSDYANVEADYTNTPRNNATKIDIPGGFKIVYKDENGFIFQSDTFLKYKNGYIRAYYRATPGIPSKTYDKVVSSIKIQD